MMKNVIFFNSNKVWGGGEKWHYTMAKILDQSGYNVLIICNKNSELAQKSRDENLSFKEISVGNYSFLNIFKKKRIKNIISGFSHATIFLNLPSDVKICAPIAKKMNHQVIYRRGMPKEIRRNFLNNYFYKFVDIFIANSKEIEKKIIKNFPEFKAKTQVIYNGVPKSEITIKKLSSPVKIGHIGRLVEQKGFNKLLSIAKILFDKGFPFKMYIAGKGPLKEALEERVAQMNLKSYVEFLGHVAPESFFKKIDLLCFTSEFEGCANALIESFQNNVPAISFAISSMPEIIDDSENGFLIDPFDLEGFANKIIKISTNEELFKKMQRQANQKINEKFLLEKKVEQIKKLIT